MLSRAVLATAIVLSLMSASAADVSTKPAKEYAVHFAPLQKLSVEVAEAMPPEHWAYQPHPESMNFGLLMSHIATTNYQFCASLEDSPPPNFTPATNKEAIVKLLSDSFEY